jgi:hypothetical protein
VLQLVELVGELRSEIEDCCSSVMSYCCEKLVVEAVDSLGTQRKGNVRRWKPLANNDSEDVTVDTGVCVCMCVTVSCKV